MKVNLSAHINHPVFRDISLAAQKLHDKAFVVGGFVRDALMNKRSVDIDIVSSGNGIELARALAEKTGQKNKVRIYKKFGTAMLQYHEMKIEFVGARKESYNKDSRKPEVASGTIEEDRLRRDFTINTMSISLQQADYGDLIDPFNGLEDLLKGVIKTPLDPQITFSDDPLRMLRAIRFATQLNFSLHSDTHQAIRSNKERMHIISQERITEELNKIILCNQPSKGFRLLLQTGLLQIVFPELAALHGVEIRKGEAHKDNFYHTIQVLDGVSEKKGDLWLRWAALLHDIAKPATKRFDNKNGWTFHGHEDKGARMTEKIFRNLKLPLDSKMKFVQKLVRLHLRPIALTTDEVTDSGLRRLLYEAGEDIEQLMTLCEADITSKNEKKVNRYLHNFKIVREKLKKVEEKDKLRNWQPPISGQEIMETFGIKPCREVGLIKNHIRESILDGLIGNNYDEAYRLMLQKGKELGLSVLKENL